uniref:Uncharacterized protein n=2 Tax=Timema TaxID=61471 RepID=A0A7R9DS27_TIMPO|nr:unnamed protein product [Timema poppensis]
MARHRLFILLCTIFITACADNSAAYNITDLMTRSRENLLALAVSVGQLSTRIPDAVIVKLLNSLRWGMKRPHATLGIPRLDPFYLKYLDIGHDIPDISSMSGHVEDVTIWNLSTYQVKHFTIVWENSAVQFNLFFPELLLKGHYDINGSFGNAIYAYGKGPFTVRLIGLEVSGVTTASFQDKSLFLESLVLDFTIQRYEGNLENMMGDEKLSQLINRMLNDSLLDVLNYFKTDISKVMSKKVLDLGNGYLKEMSFSRDDILSWLPGGSHVRNTWNTMVG